MSRRLLLAGTWMIACCRETVDGQSLSPPATVNGYTIAQQRLLVQSTARFIDQVTVFNLDDDSLRSMACRITGLHTDRVTWKVPIGISGKHCSPAPAKMIAAGLISTQTVAGERKTGRSFVGYRQPRSPLQDTGRGKKLSPDTAVAPGDGVQAYPVYPIHAGIHRHHGNQLSCGVAISRGRAGERTLVRVFGPRAETSSSAGRLLLLIEDNGIGLSPGLDGPHNGSMGMNLMYGLSREMGAGITISTHLGTRIAIEFVYDPAAGDEAPKTLAESTVHAPSTADDRLPLP